MLAKPCLSHIVALCIEGGRNSDQRFCQLISPRYRKFGSFNRFSVGSDNGLSPIHRLAIVYTNAFFFSTGPSGKNNARFIIYENPSENIVCEMVAILSRGGWVNWASRVQAQHSKKCDNQFRWPGTDRVNKIFGNWHCRKKTEAPV